MTQGSQSKTFCPMPFAHLATFTDGSCGLCCMANTPKFEDANLNNASIKEIFNHDYWKEVRLKMLNGEQISDCSRCYEEESNGYRSHRIAENIRWERRLSKNGIDDLIRATDQTGHLPRDFQSLDLRMGNTCNLQCVMCGPTDSSKWLNAAKKLAPMFNDPSLQREFEWKARLNQKNYNWYKNQKIWEEIYTTLPNIKELILAGGEPFYLEGHMDILTTIADSGYARNMRLCYHTNGTIFSQEIVDQLIKFKEVEIILSIDAVGDQNFWLRHPANWGAIVENLHLMDRIPRNIRIWINYSVTALNIFYIPEFTKFFDNQNFKYISKRNKSRFHPSIVYYPPHLNIKVLPPELKDIITKKLLSFEETLEWETDKIEGVINQMNSEDQSYLLPTLREYIDKLDDFRGTDFKATFPEIARYIYD